MANNHTSLDTLNGPSTTEIGILNIAAQVALRNNILVGTTQYALLSCQSDSQDSTAKDGPLLLDHNDLFNTAGGLVLSGTCFPNLASPLTGNGNLSVDPRFNSVTDFHPQAGSPVFDAGINLADTPPTDFDGNPRLADATGKGFPVIDLGAYERPAPLSGGIPTAVQVQPATYVLSPGTLALAIYAESLGSSAGPVPLQQGTVSLFLNGNPASTAILDSDGHASLSVPVPSPGTYALSASLAAQSGFNPASSPVVYVLVTDAPSTTTLTLTTPATQTLNQPITLTIHLGSATATGSTTPGPVPPGAVTLFEGNTILSSLQPDSTGLATYTIPRPGLGSHTYTVTYAGTTLFPAATASTSVSITAPVATTLTASATPNPAPLNAPVTCTATVVAASGPAPTGTVVFTDGATPERSVRLSSPGEQGIATLVLNNLTFGLHTLAVTFQPDPGFSPSTGTCTVNVGGNTTSTTLSSSKNPAGTTDTVSYVATVANTGTASAPPPAGSVSLSEGNTLLASAPLVPDALGSSSANLPANLTLPGIHILTATYLPATAATFTSSATLTETITAPPAIATTVSAAPNPVTFGQLTTLSAVVTSAAAIPTPPPSPSPTAPPSSARCPSPPPARQPSPSAPSAWARIPSAPSSTPATPPPSAAPPSRSPSRSMACQIPSPSPSRPHPPPSPPSPSPSPPSSLPPPPSLPARRSAAPSPSSTATFPSAPLPSPQTAAPPFTTATLTPGLHTLTVSYSGNSLLASAISAPFPEQIASNPTSTSLSVTPAATTAFAPVTLAAHVASATSAARVNTLACPPTCSPITITFVATSATGPAILGIVPVDASGNATLALNPPAGTYQHLRDLLRLAPLRSQQLRRQPAHHLRRPNRPHPHRQPQPRLPARRGHPHRRPHRPRHSTLRARRHHHLPRRHYLPRHRHARRRASLRLLPRFRRHPHPHRHLLRQQQSPRCLRHRHRHRPPQRLRPLPQRPTLTLATTHHAPTTVSIQTTGSLSDQVDLSCTNLPQFATCTFSPATHDLTATNATTGTLTLDTDALLNYARIQSPASPFHRLLRQTGPLLALCLPLSLLATLRLRPRSALGNPIAGCPTSSPSFCFPSPPSPSPAAAASIPGTPPPAPTPSRSPATPAPPPSNTPPSSPSSSRHSPHAGNASPVPARRLFLPAVSPTSNQPLLVR